jgi:hypothetical protein
MLELRRWAGVADDQSIIPETFRFSLLGFARTFSV